MSIQDDSKTCDTPGQAKEKPGNRLVTNKKFRGAVSAAAILVIISVSINLLTSDKPQVEVPELSQTTPLSPFNLTGLTIPRDEILSGGPGKDGIPALTNINTIEPEDAPYNQSQRVVVVTVDNETRGYPLVILNWHEVVNDVIGQTPIAVIYCPLCDSVSVVDRRIGDETLEFGVSGLLFNSNVLLYDRKSNGLWSQLGMRAVSGPHVGGKALRHLPWQLTTFEDFVKQFPTARILSTNTGYRRDYTQNPYKGYFQSDRLMFPVNSKDSRLGPKTAVVGLKFGNITRAYPVSVIAQAKDHKVVDIIGQSKIILQADPGSVTVVQAPDSAQVVHSFWFAWAAFYPETSVYGLAPTINQQPSTQPRAQ